MLSAMHLSSSLRPSFTWCRMLYIKQKRLQFYSKFSKNHLDNAKQYDSEYSRRNPDREREFESEYPSNSNRARYFESKYQRKNSGYERPFESPYPRRYSDHERNFKPKTFKRNTGHLRDFEEDKFRNSDKHFESRYQGRKLDQERHFEANRKRKDMNFPRQNDENLHRGKQSGSLLGKKLFKNRNFTEKEIEVKESIRNIGESEYVDDETSAEIGEMQKKGGRNKKTALPKDWSETFGTLADEEDQKKMKISPLADNERHWDEIKKETEETAHIYNHFPLSRYNRRHVPNWYARRIIKLGKEGKIREAIEVFETWMIKQDRVKPTGYEFSVLIKLLSDVGYTEKAFELYRMMGKFKIYIEDVIYTSLFNACSNSPYPEDALKLVKNLHTKMLVKGRHPNYITSLAMIKAYGMNGDIANAFRVADEAIELHLRTDLMNNLLVACIADKEAGFRHAVVVWRKFRKLGTKPDLKSYNLLLHAVDVCGIGDPLLVNKLLGKSDMQSYPSITEDIKAIEAKRAYDEDDEEMGRLAEKISLKKNSEHAQTVKQIDGLLEKYNQAFESSQDIINADNDRDENDKVTEKTQKTECDSEDNKVIDVKIENESMVHKEWWQQDIFENIYTALENTTAMTEINEDQVNLPNILDPNENFSSIIHVKQIKKPQDRLALIGGVDGILKSLKVDNVKPDMKFYTGLAQSAPHHLGDRVIDIMWAKGMKPDITFYNVLLGKRALQDKQSAWALYARLNHEEIVPNLKTFTCLATAGNYPSDGLKILQHMDDLNLQPNKYIFTALMNIPKIRFNYMKQVLQKMDHWDIQPDTYFIKVVERNIERAKQLIMSKERGETDEDDIMVLKQGLQHFITFYDKWATDKLLEQKEHPWKHFMEKKE